MSWQPAGFIAGETNVLHHEYGVCGVIICHRSKNSIEVLMIKQSRSGRQNVADGNWGFPKGHMERSDRHRNIICMQRETYEETGLNIPLLVLAAAPKLTSGKQAFAVVEHVGWRPVVKIDKDEICDFRWVSVDDVVDMTPQANPTVAIWRKLRPQIGLTYVFKCVVVGSDGPIKHTTHDHPLDVFEFSSFVTGCKILNIGWCKRLVEVDLHPEIKVLNSTKYKLTCPAI
jgi:8-oxo-dGTP pyrophosphatase MutT (NUDIX family)